MTNKVTSQKSETNFDNPNQNSETNPTMSASGGHDNPFLQLTMEKLNGTNLENGLNQWNLLLMEKGN